MDNRKSDYCCLDCGEKYISIYAMKEVLSDYTFHEDECCVCEKIKPVTHIRAFNYLQVDGNED